MQLGTTTSNFASLTSNYVSTPLSPASRSTSSLSSSFPMSSYSGKVSSLSNSRPPLPVFNHFGMLSEECLFPLSLSSMSRSAHRHCRYKHRLSIALRISSAAVSSSVAISSAILPSPALSAVLSSSVVSSSSASASGSAPVLASISSKHDLGSDDLITLLYIVNENHHATCMIASGASSQFMDLDFALELNLALDKKNTPKDLVLADRVRSKVGQIMHTYTLKLMIAQHLETLTFYITKLAV